MGAVIVIAFFVCFCRQHTVLVIGFIEVKIACRSDAVIFWNIWRNEKEWTWVEFLCYNSIFWRKKKWKSFVGREFWRFSVQNSLISPSLTFQTMFTIWLVFWLWFDEVDKMSSPNFYKHSFFFPRNKKPCDIGSEMIFNGVADVIQMGVLVKNHSWRHWDSFLQRETRLKCALFFEKWYKDITTLSLFPRNKWF